MKQKKEFVSFLEFPVGVHAYLVAQSYPTVGNPLDYKPTRLFCPWDSLGRNTRVGCHFLLQGIFPIQGLNLPLLRWQEDSFSAKP